MKHFSIDLLPILVFILFMIISLFTKDKNAQHNHSASNN